MGMDLYSKRGDEYYRFNFAGSNDGDVVSAKSCKAIADRVDALKAKLTDLMTCPGKALLEHTNEDPLHFVHDDGDKHANVDLIKEIIDTRLRSGKKMNPKLLTENKKSKAWTLWDHLAYYLDFGTDFCRKCSKLGGFKQC